MSLVEFYLNNQIGGEPANLREIRIEVNWQNGSPSASLTTNNFEFLARQASQINNWIKAGLTGGPGIMEGIPFDIKSCQSNLVFKGVLNTVHDDAEFECDRVNVPLREAGRIDYVNDVIGGFGFAFLYSEGFLTAADNIAVPYVVSTIPDYTQIMLLSISTYVMIKETAEIIRDIAYLVAEAADPFITAVAIVKIVLYLVYLTALLAGLISLLQQLIDNIIQPPKYKYGMKVNRLMQAICAKLGKNFQSSIFTLTQYKDAVIIPRKIIVPGSRDKDDAGSPDAVGYPDMNCGEFVLALQEVFNADIKIAGNQFIFERKRWSNTQSGFVIQKLAEDRWGKYNTNAGELASNYLITWELDGEELNTYDDYEGTTCQCITSPVAVTNPRNLLLRNLVERRIPFALCKRKETLTPVENLLNNVINIVNGMYNAVTGVINNLLALVNSNFQIPTAPTNILNNRIGWLRLSSDFIGVPKFGIFDGNNKLIADNKALTAAATLMTGNTLLPAPFDKGFHFLELPMRGAQYYRFQDKDQPFCCENWLEVMGDNLCKDSNGKDVVLERFVWDFSKDFANVTYRLYQNYTNNLQEKFIIDGV